MPWLYWSGRLPFDVHGCTLTDMATKNDVLASNPVPTSNGVSRGVDVDVCIGDVSGEVTMIVDHTGAWVGCGPERCYWMSSEILDLAEENRELAGEIEMAARSAIEASDVADRVEAIEQRRLLTEDAER